MEKVIFDCDNTMGIRDYPMDDAMALFYLLGNRDKVDILGITTTFGNSTVSDVYPATKSLIKELSLDIPVKKGSELLEDPKSEAAEFIVNCVNKNPGNVSIIAVGSMTNLYGAYLIDNDVFNKAGEIILMGGITETLIADRRVLNELNFSCNFKATTCVLNNGKNISIVTGNNCLHAYLPRKEFIEKLSGSRSGEYILDRCSYRFDYKVEKYDSDGSYCWDVVGTAYFLNKHLFEDNIVKVRILEENFKTGYLEIDKNGKDINIPSIKDVEEFKENIYNAWTNCI